MKNFILLLIVVFFARQIEAKDSDSSKTNLQIGLTGGFNQHCSICGDLFGGLVFPLGSNAIETNIGYSYFKNSTDFDKVKGLIYFSHGMFWEVNYFLISNIYAGGRLAINMNFIDRESQLRYELNASKDPPTYFTGFSGIGQLGYNQRIGKKLNLRLQGQVGIQNYRIATGAVYFSNSDSPVPYQLRDKYAFEKQSKILYNLGLVFIINL